MKEKIKINEKVFENLIITVAIMLYFIVISFSYYRIDEILLIIGLKIASVILLILSIIIFEIAYKKDSGKVAINGIEILVLALHALSIMQVVQITKIKFTTYTVISSSIFAIYYILKATVLHTIEERKYLKSLSDIKDIVDTKPIKKEAKKRN